MQIKNMSYIIALAEAGTLSAAGKQLGISQPTLSVFLSNLEQELGIDLFLRDKKKLIPTPAGRIYLEAARRILATQEQTLQSIRQLTTAPPIEIRIGVTPLRGSEVASKIFARFSARYPNIRLRLQEGYMQELRNMVQNGMASCSLGTCFDTESADFDYITLFREEVIVAVPAFHPLAHRPKNTSMEFPQVSGIGFQPRSTALMDDPDIAYLSLSPRYYLNLCVVTKKGTVLSESERYFIYLMIQNDFHVPYYTPDFNEAARNIWDEFHTEGGSL